MPGSKRGARSTRLPRLVSVRIGGRAWRRVADLNGFGPRDRVFVAETDAAGTTVLKFGDGTTGARLPQGKTITAEYRVGAGKGTKLTVSVGRSATSSQNVVLWAAIRFRARSIAFLAPC